ncbi:PREDICTED: THAP domain-containing protein 5-like isoform X1 [Acromyrmex echinatior]|uniref:THAP-type domain-containing protein n=2 Tax=Acromyrmex echinatior TaxID=103372 RepID=F4W718_ACREC|nr:PREDICTED: THAP domain-containing protein 5-like isoform X1 [Acromyrmex echinatior]EGI70008.1 hypothetical protein G5I_01226 [Acromyrmex echinatior]
MVVVCRLDIRICAYHKMPAGCSAPKCTNSNKDGYCCTTFAQDPNLRQKWIDAAGIPDWKPSKSALLCEVHFHSSELFRVGSKKLIRKGAIPSLFCKCQQPMKKKTFAEIQSKQRCNESIEFLPHKKAKLRSDHSYTATENSEKQENKSCKREQYSNELQEHNYCLLSKKRKSITFGSRKKYVHTAHCVVMKKPIDINTLDTFSEDENYRSNSNLDIHISSECTANQTLSTENLLSPEEYEITANQILSTENLSSPEEYEILKEKLKMAEKERDILKNKVNDLEKNIEENTEIINTILNKDQQRAIVYGTTKGSKWSDETIEKGLNLHFACGSHGYNQIIKLVAPFPSLRTLRNKIQHIKHTHREQKVFVQENFL